MTQVVFNYSSWVSEYPEFADTVDQAKGNTLFTRACLYLSNADDSPVQDIPTRTMYLNMVVAHLAQMRYGSAIRPVTGQVGRIASAGQGSVNASFDYNNGVGTQKWWNQTPYGAEFWAATARYRQFFYVPGKRPYLGP